MKSDERKLLGLQVLRFFAAFAVVLFHIGSEYQIRFGNELNPFLYGSIGVDIFFVLSGFIIAMTADPDRGAWYFFRKRLIRVVPIYWLLTFGVAAIGLTIPTLLNSTVVTIEALLKSLFFIPYERSSGIVQPLLFLGWTLNYEMFFYLIYAVCIGIGFRTPLAPLAIVVCLVVAGQLFPGGSVLWLFYTNPIMINFALGIILFIFHKNFPHVFLDKTSLLLCISFIIFLILNSIYGAPWILVGALPSTLIVLAFIKFKSKDLYLSNPLVLFGNASYSLYLSHPYIIQIVSRVSLRDSSLVMQIFLGLASSLLCVFVSVALYRYVESSSQRWLSDRWRTNV